MKNLAGNRECDERIRLELNDAGITPVRVGRLENEVPASYIGVCNDFVFVRGWYYWMVTGRVPLDKATELYEKHKELSIRVGGDCGNPHPSEHCIKVNNKSFISGYHIDTEEGLKVFADFVKNNNIYGDKCD